MTKDGSPPEPGHPPDQGKTPQSKAAEDAKTGFEQLSQGVNAAVMAKVVEYKERILAGENPTALGVPDTLRPLVEGALLNEAQPYVERALAGEKLDYSSIPKGLGPIIDALVEQAKKGPPEAIATQEKKTYDKAKLQLQERLAKLQEEKANPQLQYAGRDADDLAEEKAIKAALKDLEADNPDSEKAITLLYAYYNERGIKHEILRREEESRNEDQGRATELRELEAEEDSGTGASEQTAMGNAPGDIDILLADQIAETATLEQLSHVVLETQQEARALNEALVELGANLSHSPNVSKLSQKELISLYLEVQKSTGRENLYKLAKVATTPKEPPPTPAAQAVPGEALTGTPLEAVDPEIQALQAEVNALKRKLSESLAPETPSLTREQKILKLAKDTPGNMFFLMMILMSLMGAMEK